MMHKDLTSPSERADGGRRPASGHGLVRDLFAECIATGIGDLDLTALLPRLQREAGAADVSRARPVADRSAVTRLHLP